MNASSPRLLRGRAEAIIVSSSPEVRPVAAHDSSEKIQISRTFLTRWALTNSVTLLALSFGGLAPEGVSEMGRSVASAMNPAALFSKDETASAVAYFDTSVEKPEIVIPAIGLQSVIVEPSSNSLAVLNNALTQGAVRYPGSAKPGEEGNVFIFGHSTGLPVVHNEAYKLFNRVKELKSGDAVKIREGNREYLYIIKSVTVKRANDAKIDLSANKKLLTISTCKIIGTSEEYRYVVEAEFLRSYPMRMPLARAK